MKHITVIRRKVATMANRLKKMGLSLSKAFRKAWELIKGNSIDTKVAGVTKGNRQLALHRIAAAYSPSDVSVKLIRDTANLFDNNAIKVVIAVKGSKSYELGFLPRNLAYVVSVLMDKGMELVATFKEVRGHYERYMNYGAVISIQLV